MDLERTFQTTEQANTMVLNMGPQHPSTHGVLRIVLEVDGETVVDAKPVIGYLHTGFEKLSEHKTYNKNIPIYDRIDYLAPLSNELAYVLAVEKLIGLEVPKRAQYIRVLMAEVTRINSHLVWLGTHAHDIGAMSVLLYCFREREKVLDLYEMISGQRMMANYLRVGGCALDMPTGFEENVQKFAREFPRFIDEYETLLTENPIWKQRTRGIGVISREDAVDLSLSGPMLRGTGIAWDLRKAQPYSSYEDFEFEVAADDGGDVYARYKVRVKELRESTKIIQQCLDGMPGGDYINRNPDFVPPERKLISTSMESLIRHFKLYTEGFRPPPGEVYAPIEGPKGEIGFYIVSDGSAQPYRVRIRPPCFINLQSLGKLVRGHLISDVIAIIGSIDVVLGEVDR